MGLDRMCASGGGILGDYLRILTTIVSHLKL